MTLEYQKTFSKRKLIKNESAVDFPNKIKGGGQKSKFHRTKVFLGKFLMLGHENNINNKKCSW